MRPPPHAARVAKGSSLVDSIWRTQHRDAEGPFGKPAKYELVPQNRQEVGLEIPSTPVAIAPAMCGTPLLSQNGWHS
jgi:hypothetical protein